MAYPQEWKNFWDWQKENEAYNLDALPHGVTQGSISVFGSKYHLATSFEGILAREYKMDETVDAYSAVLKVFLAFSALESFCRSTCPELRRQYEIESWAFEKFPSVVSGPAQTLRESERIVSFLTKNVGKELKKRLNSFSAGNTDNCMHVAAAIRHAVAHGFISIRPYGTSAIASVDFCEDLSAMLIGVADEAFSAFMYNLPKCVEVS
ncbi:MAG: hypothetical protein AAFY33_01645 [Cyanobacteria bacterium J06643_4]